LLSAIKHFADWEQAEQILKTFGNTQENDDWAIGLSFTVHYFLKKIMKKYPIILCCMFCSVNLFSQNTWLKIADFGGGQRERAVAFAIGGRGYVATGQDTTNAVKKDLWEYDPSTNSWTQKADFPGAARRDAVAFVIDGKGYVGTGITHAISFLGTKQKNFYRYNPVTNSWSSVADYPGNSNQGIYYAAAFSTSSRGYVCCGKRGPSYYSDELYEYNPSTNSWSAKDDFPGGDRYSPSAFSIDNFGYVGLGVDENFYRKDMYKFDPASNDWESVADFPGSDRFNAVGFTIDGRGFIGMGSDGGYQKDLYEYNPATDSWMQKASLAGSERRACVAFVIDGYGYVGTGKGFTGKKRSFYKYTPYFLEPTEMENHALESFVSPNPVKQSATIYLESETNISSANCKVFDTNGKLVFTSAVLENNSILFEKNNLPAGVYFYSVQTENENNKKEISSGKIILL
jgi:N-acetylneuraminic acid mutarotase